MAPEKRRGRARKGTAHAHEAHGPKGRLRPFLPPELFENGKIFFCCLSCYEVRSFFLMNLALGFLSFPKSSLYRSFFNTYQTQWGFSSGGALKTFTDIHVQFKFPLSCSRVLAQPLTLLFYFIFLCGRDGWVGRWGRV